jgi:hypothetical protein
MLALLISASIAAPVEGGVQVAIGQGGFGLARDFALALPIALEEEEIASPVECWDLVGVRDFNLEGGFEDLDIFLGDGSLEVVVQFTDLYGEDMTVFSEDDDWLDLCPGLDSDLEYLRIEDLALSIELAPAVQDGRILLEVVGEPEISGDIDMDISWFPDSLTLLFFEDLFFSKIQQAIAEELPPLFDEYVNSASFSADIEGFSVTAEPGGAQVNPSALQIGAEIDIRYLDGEDCLSSTGEPPGASPVFSFPGIDDASFAFGVTERSFNKVAGQLWADGLFCASADDFEVLFHGLEDLFDTSAANLSGWASLEELPIVRVGEDGLLLKADGAMLTVTGLEDGTVLLDIEADIEARMELRLDRGISAFGLSFHDLVLDFGKLEVSGLLSGSEGGEERLIRFVEGWVAGMLESQLGELAFFQAAYSGFGLHLFVEDFRMLEGGMEVYSTLYHSSDPAVDQEPPDTEAEVFQSAGGAMARWTGSDDREGDLAYSYRVDGGSWSSWTRDTEAILEGLAPGIHLFEAKARDAWWNEDPLPAMVTFDLASLEEEADGSAEVIKEGCMGCSSTAPRPAWLLMAIAVPFLRRRRGGRGPRRGAPRPPSLQ